MTDPGPSRHPCRVNLPRRDHADSLWRPDRRALTLGLVLTITLVGFEALAISTVMPIVVREIFRIVRAVNERDKVTVLVVEQNASIALEAAAHAYVLEAGRVAVSGTSAELQKDEAVRRSYLGY